MSDGEQVVVVKEKSESEIRAGIAALAGKYDMNSKYVNMIYDSIRVMIAEKRFKKSEFVGLLRNLFLVYEKNKSMTPEQRKARIKSLLDSVLKQIPMTPEQRDYALTAIRLAGPIIDLAHDLLYSKAKDLVGKVKSGCLSKCGGESEDDVPN